MHIAQPHAGTHPVSEGARVLLFCSLSLVPFAVSLDSRFVSALLLAYGLALILGALAGYVRSSVVAILAVVAVVTLSLAGTAVAEAVRAVLAAGAAWPQAWGTALDTLRAALSDPSASQRAAFRVLPVLAAAMVCGELLWRRAFAPDVQQHQAATGPPEGEDVGRDLEDDAFRECAFAALAAFTLIIAWETVLLPITGGLAVAKVVLIAGALCSIGVGLGVMGYFAIGLGVYSITKRFFPDRKVPAPSA